MPYSLPGPAEPGPLLTPTDLAIDALDAAHVLLGCLVVREGVILRITEVEAYRSPDDTANHCRAGRTRRNAPMWGLAGNAYVYLCYGMHHLLNVVTGLEGEGCAVLIRAAEPVSGLETVLARRAGRRPVSLGPDLLAGPGKVASALGLDTSWSDHPMCEPGGLELRRGPPPAIVLVGPRVGIDSAQPTHRDAPWRLADGASRWVSHRRSLRPAG